MKKRVAGNQEPSSVGILENQIDQERTYLQNQIITIELKQIAESITRVTHAKKISAQKSTFADMVYERYGPPIVRKTRNMASQKVETGKLLQEDKEPSRDNVGLLNRPLLLKR